MKKRLGLVIIIIVALFIIGLLVWRFWPQSFSDRMSFDKNAVTGLDAFADVQRFEGGQSYTDTYRIDNEEYQESAPGEILDILATSSYQPDFRNLLPWDIDSVDADKNYDGRTVNVYLYCGDRYIHLMFLSESMVVVNTRENSGMRVYHPTNSETMNKLVEYLQTNGTAQ